MACKSKYSFQYATEIFKEKGYEIISKENDYQNASTKLQYICPKHREKGIQSITTYHLKDGRGCYYCGRERNEASRRMIFDYESDKQITESKGYEYVTTRRDGNLVVIDCICPKHRELGIQTIRYNNMKRDGQKCQYCRNKNLPDWYIKKLLKEQHPEFILLDTYKNFTTVNEYVCTIHNRKFKTTAQRILQGHGCYECGLAKLSEGNMLSDEEVQNMVNYINPNLKLIKYNGVVNESTWLCTEHHQEFNRTFTSIVTFNKGCPECNKLNRQGWKEEHVCQMLEDWGFKITRQKKLEGCEDKRPLPFDCYLDDFNVAVEYDGEGHYYPLRFRGLDDKKALTSFHSTQKHDRMKDIYCCNHNIPLIRIPYYKYEDLEDFLFDQLIQVGVLIEEVS